MSAYIFVAATVVIAIAGQLVLKWQTDVLGPFPEESGDRARYLADFLLNPWVIGVVVFFGLAVVCWMAALSKLELSRAYPFVAASFVGVMLGSAIFLGESLTAPKLVGAGLIVAGLVVGSQG